MHNATSWVDQGSAMLQFDGFVLPVRVRRVMGSSSSVVGGNRGIELRSCWSSLFQNRRTKITSMTGRRSSVPELQNVPVVHDGIIERCALVLSP